MSPHLRHVPVLHFHRHHQDQSNPGIITESNVDLFLGSSQPGSAVGSSIDSADPNTSTAGSTQEPGLPLSFDRQEQLPQRRASFSSIRTTTSIVSVPPPPYSEIGPPPEQYERSNLGQSRSPTQNRGPYVFLGESPAAATARAQSIAVTNPSTSHSAHFGLVSDNEPESSGHRRSNPPGAPLRNSLPTIVDATRARNSNPALHYMEYAANRRSDVILMGHFGIVGKATFSGFRTPRR